MSLDKGIEKADRLVIFDTTLRDGEQAPGYSMNTDEKVRMALQLEALGVDVLEAGFPAASAGDFAGVAAVAGALKRPVVAALARALKEDIDAAAAALAAAQKPRIHVFIATSDIHLEHKLGISRDECLRRIAESVAYARSKVADVEFSAEDATRTGLDFLCRALETAIRAGATTVNIPDTVGYSTPGEYGALIAALIARVPNISQAVISTHCHDDLGLASANTLAGLVAGARQAECTIGGIGERAGNAALEEVVMSVKTRPERFGGLSSSIDTTEIARSAALLANITGIKIAPNKAIVGANAFAHESGIHQHGILADERTYEIISPESVGAHKTSLVLGKHSGRHAFAARLAAIGYPKLGEKKIDTLFAEFKALADSKKTIDERDLVALVEANWGGSDDSAAVWRLESFVVNSGDHMCATAQVKLSRGGKSRQEAALGSGPVYAAFAAIERIVRRKFVLEDYQIRAVTERRDALGEVLVKIADKRTGGIFRGRGVSTDIIKGSILALLSAINKIEAPLAP